MYQNLLEKSNCLIFASHSLLFVVEDYFQCRIIGYFRGDVFMGAYLLAQRMAASSLEASIGRFAQSD